MDQPSSKSPAGALKEKLRTSKIGSLLLGSTTPLTDEVVETTADATNKTDHPRMYQDKDKSSSSEKGGKEKSHSDGEEETRSRRRRRSLDDEKRSSSRKTDDEDDNKVKKGSSRRRHSISGDERKLKTKTKSKKKESSSGGTSTDRTEETSADKSASEAPAEAVEAVPTSPKAKKSKKKSTSKEDVDLEITITPKSKRKTRQSPTLAVAAAQVEKEKTSRSLKSSESGGVLREDDDIDGSSRAPSIASTTPPVTPTIPASPRKKIGASDKKFMEGVTPLSPGFEDQSPRMAKRKSSDYRKKQALEKMEPKRGSSNSQIMKSPKQSVTPRLSARASLTSANKRMEGIKSAAGRMNRSGRLLIDKSSIPAPPMDDSAMDSSMRGSMRSQRKEGSKRGSQRSNRSVNRSLKMPQRRISDDSFEDTQPELLEEAIVYLKEQQDRARKDAAKAQAELVKVKMDFQKLQGERRELRAELKDCDVIIQERDRKILALEKAVESQLDKVDMLEDDLRKSNDEIYEMEGRMLDLEEKVSLAAATLPDGSTPDGDNVQRDLNQQREARIEKRQKELDEQVQKMKLERERLDAMKSKNESDLMDLHEREIEAMKHVHDELLDKIQEKDEAIEEMQRKLEVAWDLSSHGGGAQKSASQNGKSSPSDGEKDETISALNEEISRLKQDLDAVKTGEYGHLRREIEAKTSEAQVMKSQFEGAQRRYMVLEEDIDHWKGLNCTLEDEVQAYKTEANEWKQKYEQLQRENEVLGGSAHARLGGRNLRRGERRSSLGGQSPTSPLGTRNFSAADILATPRREDRRTEGSGGSQRSLRSLWGLVSPGAPPLSSEQIPRATFH